MSSLTGEIVMEHLIENQRKKAKKPKRLKVFQGLKKDMKQPNSVSTICQIIHLNN